MFNILGLKGNVRNVVRLCKAHLALGATGEELKKAYQTFLMEIQPSVPLVKSNDISFLYKFKDIKLLLQIFEEESLLDDFEEIFDASNLSEQENSIAAIKSALDQMHEINEEFYLLVNLVINTIFSASSKLAGGGSTSAAIGCIWANLRPHWKNEDVIEFLIHETTHNLLFIDELCYSHYSDYSKLAQKKNFSWSAILNKLRPIDKVFHSIIVSTEVLLLREYYIGHSSQPCLHPNSKIMLEQTLYSLNSLREKCQLSNLLSTRGSYLLNLCYEKLQTIDQTITNLVYV